MPRKEEAYVCKRCGYVLLKKNVVVSGWDAEGSSTHVHCLLKRQKKEERIKIDIQVVKEGKFLVIIPSVSRTHNTTKLKCGCHDSFCSRV